ncbi:MAG: putative signal transduction histidine kinase, partial [Flavipsychrobacter sp.]|nr:putative signal transduction histidine kinase [Flavipsychrobacter sp.]
VYPKAFLLELPFHFEEYWGEMGAWFDVIIYNYNDTLSVSFKSSNTVPSDHPDHPEQRLKIQNELYRFITEVSNDSLWEWDIKTNELFWLDGGHKKVFGYDIENAYIPRDFWASRIHPEDKVRVLEKLEQVVHDGSSIVWEDDYRFQKMDGTYAYVHDNGYVIFDDNKQPVRMIGTTLDVTESKLCAIRLEETEEKLAKIEYRINAKGKLSSKTNEEHTKSDTANGIKDSLANISLSTEMLAAHVSEKDLQLFIDIILSNTKKISELVTSNDTA